MKELDREKYRGDLDPVVLVDSLTYRLDFDKFRAMVLDVGYFEALNFVSNSFGYGIEASIDVECEHDNILGPIKDKAYSDYNEKIIKFLEEQSNQGRQ